MRQAPCPQELTAGAPRTQPLTGALTSSGRVPDLVPPSPCPQPQESVQRQAGSLQARHPPVPSFSHGDSSPPSPHCSRAWGGCSLEVLSGEPAVLLLRSTTCPRRAGVPRREAGPLRKGLGVLRAMEQAQLVTSRHLLPSRVAGLTCAQLGLVSSVGLGFCLSGLRPVKDTQQLSHKF